MEDSFHYNRFYCYECDRVFIITYYRLYDLWDSDIHQSHLMGDRLERALAGTISW